MRRAIKIYALLTYLLTKTCKSIVRSIPTLVISSRVLLESSTAMMYFVFGELSRTFCTILSTKQQQTACVKQNDPISSEFSCHLNIIGEQTLGKLISDQNIPAGQQGTRMALTVAQHKEHTENR